MSDVVKNIKKQYIVNITVLLLLLLYIYIEIFFFFFTNLTFIIFL